jgi:peptide/nickel transport system ATP-binding protein
MTEKVLQVEDLVVEYSEGSSKGMKRVRALNQVSLSLKKGEILGIVGESGCGKSTLALACVGLLPKNGRVVSGEVSLRGQVVESADGSKMEQLRGTGIAMIFQEPLTSLNPVYRISHQMTEAIRVRNSRARNQTPKEFRGLPQGPSRLKMGTSVFSRIKTTPEERREIVELLRAVRIDDAENVIDKYPHELSGGMRQRAMIAIALSQQPDVLFADEPTTALDVTTQAKVLSLIRDLTDEYGTAVVLISHDLSVVSQVSDNVQVMYLGEAVEYSTTKRLFSAPLHPYTQGLIHSFPTTWVEESQLSPIPGLVPSPADPPSGCRFHPRCPHAFAPCATVDPKPVEIEASVVSCHLYPGRGENGR